LFLDYPRVLVLGRPDDVQGLEKIKSRRWCGFNTCLQYGIHLPTHVVDDPPHNTEVPTHSTLKYIMDDLGVNCCKPEIVVDREYWSV
jgi:hypothetical protein